MFFKYLLIFLTCSTLLIGQKAMACSCSFDKYEEDIKRTKSLVLREFPLVESHGVLKGGLKTACAVLKFKISESGKAVDIEVVESSPPKVLDRVATKTLILYKFKSPAESSREYYYLSFEYSI